MSQCRSNRCESSRLSLPCGGSPAPRLVVPGVSSSGVASASHGWGCGHGGLRWSDLVYHPRKHGWPLATTPRPWTDWWWSPWHPVISSMTWCRGIGTCWLPEQLTHQGVRSQLMFSEPTAIGKWGMSFGETLAQPWWIGGRLSGVTGGVPKDPWLGGYNCWWWNRSSISRLHASAAGTRQGSFVWGAFCPSASPARCLVQTGHVVRRIEQQVIYDWQYQPYALESPQAGSSKGSSARMPMPRGLHPKLELLGLGMMLLRRRWGDHLSLCLVKAAIHQLFRWLSQMVRTLTPWLLRARHSLIGGPRWVPGRPSVPL